jgi:hypothetical protein
MQRLREHVADLSAGSAGHAAIGVGAGLLKTLVSRATAQLCIGLPGIRVTAASA